MSRSRWRAWGRNSNRARFIYRRTFKAVLGITPREYADSCRMRGFRQKLKAGHWVTRAMHDAGYSSTSRLYSRTSAELGMEPAKYRRGAIAAPIRYSVTDSPIGRMLIAATDKGICTIQFADSEEELEQGLKQEFPFAIQAARRSGYGQIGGTGGAPDLATPNRCNRFRSIFKPRHFSGGSGLICNPSPSEKPNRTPRLRKPSGVLRQFVQ